MIADKKWTPSEMSTFEDLHFGPQRFLLLLDLLHPLSPLRFLCGCIPRTRPPHLLQKSFIGKKYFWFRKAASQHWCTALQLLCRRQQAEGSPQRVSGPSPDCQPHVLFTAAAQGSLLANRIPETRGPMASDPNLQLMLRGLTQNGAGPGVWETRPAAFESVGGRKLACCHREAANLVASASLPGGSLERLPSRSPLLRTVISARAPRLI